MQHEILFDTKIPVDKYILEVTLDKNNKKDIDMIQKIIKKKKYNIKLRLVGDENK